MVSFKVYDAEEEAVGTPLENNPKLKMKDSKYYLQSDLARILLLYKYGGIWADMDIIFLRDFKPILDQEYMYMWGSETDFVKEGACATVLSLHKNSQLSLEFLKELNIKDTRKKTVKYIIEFPKNVKSNKVDESLIFIFSTTEKKCTFLTFCIICCVCYILNDVINNNVHLKLRL